MGSYIRYKITSKQNHIIKESNFYKKVKIIFHTRAFKSLQYTKGFHDHTIIAVRFRPTHSLCLVRGMSVMAWSMAASPASHSFLSAYAWNSTPYSAARSVRSSPVESSGVDEVSSFLTSSPPPPTSASAELGSGSSSVFSLNTYDVVLFLLLFKQVIFFA